MVPEWRSAYYWPLLIAENGQIFKSFVKIFLLLDPFFIAYNESAAKNVFNGFTKFRTLALSVNFES